MKDAENTPNVVKVCNKPGLFDELEGLQKRLVLIVLYVYSTKGTNSSLI